PGCHRIGNSSEDNGNGPGRLLGGHGDDRDRGHDDVDLEANQFGYKSGEPIELPLGRSVFDDDVVALDVAVVTQPLKEGLVGDAPRLGCKVAYSSDLCRLLGLGGNRVEDPTEHEGHAEGESQPCHLGSGPSNLFKVLSTWTYIPRVLSSKPNA